MTNGRGAIYTRLERRNRVVRWLRIAVPILGALVLAVLIVEIVIANLAQNYHVGGINVTRDKVVIDTPRYTGVMANGTTYTVTAKAAATVPGTPDVLALSAPTLDLVRPDGYEMQIVAKTGRFALGKQIVDVAGVAHVTDSRGMRAELTDSVIDWAAQTLVTRERVHVVFADGSVLNADALRYDAQAQTWDFSRSELAVFPADSEAQ